MNIQNIQAAAIDAINSILNRGLEVEVIQFRGDVWDEIVEYHKKMGIREPSGHRWEFCGRRAEKKELMPYTTFRVVTESSNNCGMAFHEVLTNDNHTFVYSVFTPSNLAMKNK
ncbi:hypothetical protein OQZ55_15090 [Bacillus subtilis]|uniref:Uncharacterized protein n=1 Tax=Bacillus cabrialesii subsp. tritici TaxID=2944916 RepID=A0ABT9DN24_9BACI|nr:MULTISPECIES: hypothetical protein [Bacillus]MCX4077521.1 hypothetical protein [Bacillus subtilis]MDO8226116.1 hypothetical protein [Bacillus cabrialesii subsp. tritici]